MLKYKAYKYRFYPTKEQKKNLERTFGCARVVYNYMLHLRKEQWSKNNVVIDYATTSKILTHLKKQPDYIWLNEVAAVPLQQSLRHLQSAYKNFYSKSFRYPQFKKKNHKQSIEYTRSGFKYSDGCLFLAKHKQPLDIKFSRSLPKGLKPTSVTVSCDSSGRYHISMLVKMDIAKKPKAHKHTGLDLGISNLVVDSDGTKVDNPRIYEKHQVKLARAERKFAKKKRGSKNREKERKKVAKIHAKISDSRKDFTHKLTTRLINENQVLAVEDLCVKGMLKNKILAKHISDANWGELLRQLTYKAEWYGRELVKVDRFFPSSKTCNKCRNVIGDLPLSARIWECSNCGSIVDRDVNAAKNILTVGQTVLAFGGDVSLISR